MNNVDDFLRNKYGNRRPFKVPENYFDDFQHRIMSRIHEEVVPGTTVNTRRNFLKRNYIRLLAAASVAVLAVLGVWSFLSRSGETEQPTIAQIVSRDTASPAAEQAPQAEPTTSAENPVQLAMAQTQENVTPATYMAKPVSRKAVTKSAKRSAPRRQAQTVTSALELTTDDIDEAVDVLMIDDDDMYAYILDNE